MVEHLNIGCGVVYKPGCINIDQLSEELVDVVAKPYSLNYADNSIDLIESHYLIEQLSYEEVLISLEEWFRVLKPGGKLIIETLNPDAIIEDYIKTDEIEYKDILINKLYESENGIKYKSSFFFYKLSSLLHGIGFDNINEQPPKNKPFQEAFRLQCEKIYEFKPFQILIKTKIDTMKNIKELGLGHQKPFWEFNEAVSENLLKNIINSIRIEKLNLNRDFHRLVIYSPKIAIILAKYCVEAKLISQDIYKYVTTIIELLIKHQYTNCLYRNYIELDKSIERTIDYYFEFLENESEEIEKIFKTPEVKVEMAIKKYLKDLLDSIPEFEFDLSNNIFSFEIIKEQTEILEMKALKLLAENKIDEANKILSFIVKANPERVLSLLNLGLLECHKKNYSNARELFYNAQKQEQVDIINVLIATCDLYLKDFEKSITNLIKVEEDSLTKYMALGNSYFYINKIKEAKEAFGWAVIISNDPRALANLALVNRLMGNKKEEIATLKKINAINSNIPIPEVPYLPKLINRPLTIEDLNINVNKNLQPTV